MAKFKVGDRVRSTYPSNNGEEGVIKRKGGKSDCWWIKGFTYGETGPDGLREYSECYLELISSNNQITMDLKEKFTLAFKSEPNKSFRKAGITNGDDFLTEEGQQVFLGWLLHKHGDDFKKEVVDDLLKGNED
jgi:hypothetical protein